MEQAAQLSASLHLDLPIVLFQELDEIRNLALQFPHAAIAVLFVAGLGLIYTANTTWNQVFTALIRNY